MYSSREVHSATLLTIGDFGAELTFEWYAYVVVIYKVKASSFLTVTRTEDPILQSLFNIFERSCSAISNMQLTIVIAALATTTTALGINCRGSSTCGIAAGDLRSIQTLVNGADDNRRYNSGQQVRVETSMSLEGEVSCSSRK